MLIAIVLLSLISNKLGNDLDSDTQWAFICSKLTIETLEQDVKYVQIYQ